MKEQRLYGLAIPAGVLVLLAGIALHSWLAVAAGALVAGAGGLFGMLSMVGRNDQEERDRDDNDD
ncbi:MAG TPA: hypothetical protein VFD58_18945 [Blastocatellia bacterium]|nr:hypothetical protein [Blastocatellia bacterium]